MNNAWSDWIDGEPQESDVPVGEMLVVKTRNNGIHHIPMWGFRDMRPIDIVSYQRRIKQKIQFKKMHPDAIIPTRANPGDAGFDLTSIETCVIGSGRRKLIDTGLQVAIPDGWVGFVKSRSGMAVNLCVDAEAGVIDSGYRGPLKVLLHNSDDSHAGFEAGHKIAQLVVVPYMGEAEEVGELSDTVRGEGGFGSTGS